MQESAISLAWLAPTSDATGGSAITGYKLYQYEGADLNAVTVDLSTGDSPVKQEVQTITLSGGSLATGDSFTVAYGDSETADIEITVNAGVVTSPTDAEFKQILENLDSVGIVDVAYATNVFTVTFVSQAGNLPMMQVR